MFFFSRGTLSENAEFLKFSVALTRLLAERCGPPQRCSTSFPQPRSAGAQVTACRLRKTDAMGPRVAARRGVPVAAEARGPKRQH